MLDRPNLPDAVARSLRRQILEHALRAGERLNEVALAARLGVSRTPLREALSSLVSEGFVEQVPRRGFFVRPLSADEARQIYPVRAILDPAALALAGVPPAAELSALRAINREIERSAGGAETTLELDERWHRRLVSGCPNRELLALIDRYIDRTQRYELAYFRASKHVAVAVGEHDRILDVLRAGDLEAACRALEDNMRSAVGPILAWLASREARARRPVEETP